MANTHQEIVCSIKQQLKTAVEKKVRLTTERVEYKTTVKIGDMVTIQTEAGSKTYCHTKTDRDAWFSSIDSRRVDAKHQIRHLHLAYGYVRGQTHKRMESKCKVAPSSYYILDILSDFEFPEATPELLDIQEWLAGDPSIFSWEDADPEAKATEVAA
jgi:hypothetical protein